MSGNIRHVASKLQNHQVEEVAPVDVLACAMGTMHISHKIYLAGTIITPTIIVKA